MKVPAHGGGYSPKTGSAPSIIVHALRSNKRPIGFARDWPNDEPVETKRKKRKKRRRS